MEEAQNLIDEKRFYVVRTTSNREDQVLDFLANVVEHKKLPIFSIVKPHGARGYVFVEAASREVVEEAIRNIPYTKGLLKDAVSFKDIENLVREEKQKINIQKGDICELISGPFKGSKCKVTRIDTTKNEAVIVLLDSAVSIPVTISISALRLIRHEEKEEA